MDGQRESSQEQAQAQAQEIVMECSPTFCACDENEPRCLNGYENNRSAALWRDSMAQFHLDRVQQRIDATMQPSHREDPTSSLRRRVMANRLLTQQNTELLGRRPNINLANSMLFRRQARAMAQPFGQLVPEQAQDRPLQGLAAPQGRDQLIKDNALVCNQDFCLSGDSDSEASLEQSRRRQRQE